MKYLILILTILIACNLTYAQKKGRYVSDMGISCQISKVDQDNLLVEAGGSSDVYERESGKVFKCTTPKYANYRMRVDSETKVYAYQVGRSGTFYTYRDDQAIANAMMDCELSDKYLEKMGTEPGNAQVWAFCGQAGAIICATEPGSGRDEQIGTIAKTLKYLYTSGQTPCADAISQRIWGGQ
ncbi:hypothetical protein [Ekhidna sp.]|uniref:hypothetical protein n=1 Tax=Ekhidna sp. TaxID=2608089 RepID=UPI00329783D2